MSSQAFILVVFEQYVSPFFADATIPFNIYQA